MLARLGSLIGGYGMRRSDLRPLYLALFLSFLGTSVAFPLRLLYAQVHGATPARLGVLAASFLLAPLVAQLPLGWLVDRWGRVPVLMCGIHRSAISAEALRVREAFNLRATAALRLLQPGLQPRLMARPDHLLEVLRERVDTPNLRTDVDETFHIRTIMGVEGVRRAEEQPGRWRGEATRGTGGAGVGAGTGARPLRPGVLGCARQRARWCRTVRADPVNPRALISRQS